MESIDVLPGRASDQLALLLREQRYGPFVRALNEAFQQFGPSAELYRYAADYTRTTGKQAELYRFLLQWAAIAPNDPSPRWQLADLFDSLGKTDNAVEALSLAENAGADPIQVAVRKVQVLLAGGRYALAVEQAARELAEQSAVLPVVHLLRGLSMLAANLAAAEGRADLRNLARSVARRSLSLRADAAGLLLDAGTTAKRLGKPNRKPDLVDDLCSQIRVRSCGCVIGSADLLDLAGPAARVHDGSFWGRRSRVYVLECDEDLLTLGLATFDLRDVLADEVVTWLWGPGALEQLERLLAERENEPLLNITISSNPHVPVVVDRAAQLFHREMATCFQQVGAYYANLPQDHWRDILGNSPSRPPRILLITTEFSSFMKFATRDLAATFQKMGWQVHVAKESQPTHVMSGMAVLRAVAAFRPDVVWQINYMRSAWQGAVPDGLPFVCWDQDTMPHLASHDLARRMGKFDFLACLGSGVGYIRRYGYPVEQLLHMPMCIDHSVFHPDPAVEPFLGASYVSHHGWTVDNRIDKVLENLPSDVHDALLPAVRRYVDRLQSCFAGGYPLRMDQTRVVLAESLAACNLQIAQKSIDSLSDYLYRIVANAVWRHQAIRMAVESGVPLRLYGQGWQDNPEFRRFSAGAIEHGSGLARMLQSSRVALQAVLAGNEHQRLWEAAACGAITLMRYHPNDDLFTVLRGWMDRLEQGRDRPLAEVIPESMRRGPAECYTYDFIRLGLSPQGGILGEPVLQCLRHAVQFPSVRDKLGSTYDDLVFRSQAEFADKLQRIFNDRQHADLLRDRLAGVVAAHHGYNAQIARLIRQIRERLLRG